MTSAEMRLTLVHNPTAGHDGVAREDLLRALRDAGHEAAYHSIKADNLAEALREPGDLVVVAGGDGTIRRAARHLVGRGIPLAVLPIGTANNISKTLGIAGPVRDLIDRLPSARRRAIDVGVARGPWGRAWFLEAVGFGVFPELMAALEADGDGDQFTRPEEELERDLHALCETLAIQQPRVCALRLDDTDLSGRYLSVEALNMRSVGPNLRLAPDADPGDALLDLVLLPEEERSAFQEYLRRRLEGHDAPPGLRVRRGARLQIAIDEGERLHVDDQRWPKGNHPPGGGPGSPAAWHVDVGLEPRALEFLIP